MESLTDLSWIHSLWAESYLIQLPRYLFPHTLRHTATMLSKYLRIFSNISHFFTQIFFVGGILSDTTSRYLFPHTLHHTATIFSNHLRIFSNIYKLLTKIFERKNLIQLPDIFPTLHTATMFSTEDTVSDIWPNIFLLLYIFPPHCFPPHCFQNIPKYIPFFYPNIFWGESYLIQLPDMSFSTLFITVPPRYCQIFLQSIFPIDLYLIAYYTWKIWAYFLHLKIFYWKISISPIDLLFPSWSYYYTSWF